MQNPKGCNAKNMEAKVRDKKKKGAAHLKHYMSHLCNNIYSVKMRVYWQSTDSCS